MGGAAVSTGTRPPRSGIRAPRPRGTGGGAGERAGACGRMRRPGWPSPVRAGAAAPVTTVSRVGGPRWRGAGQGSAAGPPSVSASASWGALAPPLSELAPVGLSAARARGGACRGRCCSASPRAWRAQHPRGALGTPAPGLWVPGSAPPTVLVLAAAFKGAAPRHLGGHPAGCLACCRSLPLSGRALEPMRRGVWT